MIPHYPYYHSSYYRYYPHYSYTHSNSFREHNNDIVNTFKEEKNSKKSYKKASTENLKEERQYFDMLGIRLYLDDILLICLIFFLYNEGIQDQNLFICLILLLLS